MQALSAEAMDLLRQAVAAEGSQARAAKRVGISAAAVSLLLKGEYGADTTKMERKPREPSPLDDAPAVPTITSILSGELAQVVGDDGTVLQPVIVGVGAGSGAPITTDRFELRYRLKDSSEWSSVIIPADKASTWLLGYDPGDILQLQLRAWSRTNEPSLWSPMIEYTVLARTRRPPNVATFAFTPLSNGLRRFDWTLSDPDGDGPPADLFGYRIRYRAGIWSNWADLGPLHTGVQTSWPIDTVTPQIAGTYTFGIVAVLNDGQESALPLLSVVILPNGVAPNVPVVLVSPATPTNDNTLSFSGTGDASTTIHLLVGGVDVASVAVAGGAWALTSPPVADGNRSVTFTSVDAGGHASDPTAPIVIQVDTAAPGKPVISTAPGSTYDRTPTITGTTTEPGAHMDLYRAGSTLIGTTTADGSGNWSITSAVLPIGANSITAKATDAVGNPSVASDPVVITVTALDADAAAAIAAFAVEPSSARMGLINDYILALKAAGVWAKATWLSLHAAHHEQAARVNLRNPAQIAAAIGSPVFTVDRGFKGTGDGATVGGYLSTGINVATAGGFYALNDAHLSVWVRTAASSTTNGAMAEIGNNLAFISTHNATVGQIITRLNDNVSTGVAAGTPNSTGFFCISRGAVGSYARYHNTTSLGDLAVTSTSVFSDVITLLRRGTSTHSDAEISASSFGGNLAAAEEAALHDAQHAYLLAVGAI